MTRLALGILVLASLFVLSLASPGNAFEVSPANPSPGEEIVIEGKASPDEDVRIRSSFQMDLPAVGGRYEYETRVEIPQKPNRFTVTARNVLDLNAGVKMLVWITRRFEASGGVATVSQSDVPPGRYALKIFGEAWPGATVVPVKVEADTTVKADSDGIYRLAMDTSGIPAGDYSIEVDGDSKTLRIGSPAASASKASADKVEAGDEGEGEDEDTGGSSASRVESGSSALAITPEVVRWYAGEIGLDPENLTQYAQAEKSLRIRVKGGLWRVIAFGQPLTEEAGNCEEVYCLVRGIGACTACREKDMLNEPDASAAKPQENESLHWTKNATSVTSSAGTAKEGAASIKGLAEEKGFIDRILGWIWG